MYTRVNIIPQLVATAETFIYDNERSLYVPFFETAERFCNERGVVIGGKVGLDLLIGAPFTKDSFFWELYCGDTFNTAREFADAIAGTTSAHIPARTTSLQTNIKHREFTVNVNARMLFKIYSLDRYRGVDLAALMSPAKRQAPFTRVDILCVPEEIQLIDIYRSLYSPAKVSSWKQDLETEKVVYEAIARDLTSRAGVVLGGDPRGFSERIFRALDPREYILVGDYALHAMGLEESPGRLQIITSTRVQDLTKGITRRLGVKLTYTKYPLNLPTDFQITKHTVYIKRGRDQIPIMDVFNSTEYELIPWRKYTGVKVGNPWVVLRFMMIDVWVLRLILNLDAERAESARGRISAIVSRISALRASATSADPAELFQLDNYDGVYVDQNVAKKKMIKEIGERFPNYYPAKNNS